MIVQGDRVADDVLGRNDVPFLDRHDGPARRPLPALRIVVQLHEGPERLVQGEDRLHDDVPLIARIEEPIGAAADRAGGQRDRVQQCGVLRVGFSLGRLVSAPKILHQCFKALDVMDGGERLLDHRVFGGLVQHGAADARRRSSGRCRPDHVQVRVHQKLARLAGVQHPEDGLHGAFALGLPPRLERFERVAGGIPASKGLDWRK